MNMTVDGSGGAEIRLQGVENYSFCDADGGANGAASSGDDDSSVDDNSDPVTTTMWTTRALARKARNARRRTTGRCRAATTAAMKNDTAEYTTDVRAAEAPVGSAPPHFSFSFFFVT